jgi:hypothetical protein
MTTEERQPPRWGGGSAWPAEDPEPPVTGRSGDPLLKRLVDLAKVGWEADLVLFSNGSFIRGRLISGVKFRAALAQSIRAREGSDFDALVARIVAAEDPPVPNEEETGPEPRFIHLADVRLGAGSEVRAPYLRLRLPAVSGFWIASKAERDAEPAAR